MWNVPGPEQAATEDTWSVHVMHGAPSARGPRARNEQASNSCCHHYHEECQMRPAGSAPAGLHMAQGLPGLTSCMTQRCLHIPASRRDQKKADCRRLHACTISLNLKCRAAAALMKHDSLRSYLTYSGRSNVCREGLPKARNNGKRWVRTGML